MIVDFATHGTRKKDNSGQTSAKSVSDYLLNKERTNNKTARIIRGDKLLTDTAIDLADTLKFSSTYTAGWLSFDKEEVLNDEQKQEIMASFEDHLLPDFDPARYTCYWVEHTDKGRLELNFVFAKIDLKTSKPLDIFYHKTDMKRQNFWKEIQTQKYNLKDPNAPKHERDFIPTATKYPHILQSDDEKILKEKIKTYIENNVNANKINDITGVKRFIEFQNGDSEKPTNFKVKKQNKRGIVVTDTLKNEEFRMNGRFFSSDFVITQQDKDNEKSRIELDRQQRQQDYERQAPKRLKDAILGFEERRAWRAGQLAKRFDNVQIQDNTADMVMPLNPSPKRDLNHDRQFTVFEQLRASLKRIRKQQQQEKRQASTADAEFKRRTQTVEQTAQTAYQDIQQQFEEVGKGFSVSNDREKYSNRLIRTYSNHDTGVLYAREKRERVSTKFYQEIDERTRKTDKQIDEYLIQRPLRIDERVQEFYDRKFAQNAGYQKIQKDPYFKWLHDKQLELHSIILNAQKDMDKKTKQRAFDLKDKILEQADWGKDSDIYHVLQNTQQIISLQAQGKRVPVNTITIDHQLAKFNAFISEFQAMPQVPSGQYLDNESTNNESTNDRSYGLRR